jgi:N-acetylglucosamine-6-phosphate deacetylase
LTTGPGSFYTLAVERTLIWAERVITPFEALEDREILIADGKILEISPGGTIRDFDRRIEASIAAPGFIDVHVQGAGGADVLDAAPEALDVISATCARFGVTGYLATTVYRHGGDNRHLGVAARACEAAKGRSSIAPGAELLGIHLEGPFIAAGKRGMIQEDCLAPANGRTVELIRDLTGGHLRMMTMAPELPGALELVPRLQAEGVIASFGHSQANYEQTAAGIEAGIHHATHLFNAMMPMHHRDPGPVPALLESDQVNVQVIADGVHIHAPMLRLAARSLTGNRLVLITDGMQAMGLPDGRYLYNGLDYESRNGTARYLDGTLIGTSLGMSELAGRWIAGTGCSLEQAIRGASYNPARVLGLQDRKGSLEVGKDADLVLLETDLRVRMTFRAGRCIYGA